MASRASTQRGSARRPYREPVPPRQTLSRDVGLRLPSPLEEISDPALAAAGITLLLKRDDLIDPLVPGNEWRKLPYNLAAAEEQGHTTLLTFGGAYSNHIRATAAANGLALTRSCRLE
jgi:1-aminocyclopropane-1-carboxylate deaminase